MTAPDPPVATPEEEAELERVRGKFDKAAMLRAQGITPLEDVLGREYVPSANGAGGDAA